MIHKDINAFSSSTVTAYYPYLNLGKSHSCRLGQRRWSIRGRYCFCKCV